MPRKGEKNVPLQVRDAVLMERRGGVLLYCGVGFACEGTRSDRLVGLCGETGRCSRMPAVM